MLAGRGISKMRVLGIVALGAALGGCAFQRAEIAQDARAQMVGMTREQVLACMGAPANKAAEGSTEVWGFASGNDMTVATASYDRYGGNGARRNRGAATQSTVQKTAKIVRSTKPRGQHNEGAS
jgi:outer membrane protein assembly factor BamE (lipoprotein component of BamABCDE complex)